MRSKELFALVLLCGAIACETSDPTPAELSAQADDLLFQRSYDAAARTYEKALVGLSGAPRDAERSALERDILKRLAETRHHYLSDVPGALRAYRALAESAPEGPDGIGARIAIARILRDRQNDREAALAELESVLDTITTVQPSGIDAPRLHFELAQLAFSLGRYNLTERHAEKALDSAPLRQEAQLLLASTYEVKERTDDALGLYMKMLDGQLDTEVRSRVNYELGRILEGRGELSLAADHYRAARTGANSPAVIEARLSRIKLRQSGAKQIASSIRP